MAAEPYVYHLSVLFESFVRVSFNDFEVRNSQEGTLAKCNRSAIPPYPFPTMILEPGNITEKPKHRSLSSRPLH